MIAIALLFILLLNLGFPTDEEAAVAVIPPTPNYAPYVSEVMSWDEFHAETYAEFESAFTVHFHALEFKRAKNGASMIRTPGAKSFRFVAKGK
jgi:hypothetical protein